MQSNAKPKCAPFEPSLSTALPGLPERAPPNTRALVAGGGGFIGAHLASFLKRWGCWVRIADIQRNPYWAESAICDEFVLEDLRTLEACGRALAGGVDWVFNLAADMGGMGFIRSNHATILYNNTMISYNMLEAARRAGVARFFYSSSACIYPEHLQMRATDCVLREEDAWPAQPQDAYGLEKIATEELCKHYRQDFGLHTVVARFHNIYGPCTTWWGGREKSPAALCRKAYVSADAMVLWGDGTQTRTFCYVEDCIEGIMRLFWADHPTPVNVGSDELISISDMAKMALAFADKPHVKLVYKPGPIGVQGRSSDNSYIQKIIGWAPRTPLHVGLRQTYDWIREQIDKEVPDHNPKTFGCYADSIIAKIEAPS